jgi:hypothetical protein
MHCTLACRHHNEIRTSKLAIALTYTPLWWNSKKQACWALPESINPSINYLPDEASGVHEFSTMNRQDGHFQFDPKRSNLRSYAHGQSQGSSPGMGGKQNAWGSD